MVAILTIPVPAQQPAQGLVPITLHPLGIVWGHISSVVPDGMLAIHFIVGIFTIPVSAQQPAQGR